MIENNNVASAAATANPLADWNNYYHSQGLDVLPVGASSKQPVEKGWTRRQKVPHEQQISRFRPDSNIGIRLGEWSEHTGLCVVVLDVDIKSNDPRHIAEVNEAIARLLGSGVVASVRTGSGGLHFYLLCPRGRLPTKARTLIAHSKEKVPGTGKWAWAVELLGTGAYCVAPPSVHPETKRRYELMDPTGIKFFPMPESLFQALATGQPTKPGNRLQATTSPATSPPETPENITRLREALAFIPASIDRVEWLKVLFSISAHGWQCGETIAREWSATCPEKFSEEEFSKAWNSDKAVLRRVAE